MKCQRVFFPLFVVCLGFCFTGNLVLASGADLAIISISGPVKAFLNQTISITYEVTNQGDVVSEVYEVGLYLSKDTTIGHFRIISGGRTWVRFATQSVPMPIG